MKFIESGRVYLRDLNENDVDMLFELHNNKETMKFMPYNSISYERAVNDVKDYASVSVTQPGFGIWATVLKETDEVIGWTCLKRLPNIEEVEIGYRYFPKYWNKGYCTEICRELLRYGFEDLNLNEIMAIIRPENIASICVAEKLGMSYIKNVSHFGMDLKEYMITKESYNNR